MNHKFEEFITSRKRTKKLSLIVKRDNFQRRKCTKYLDLTVKRDNLQDTNGR